MPNINNTTKTSSGIALVAVLFLSATSGFAASDQESEMVFETMYDTFFDCVSADDSVIYEDDESSTCVQANGTVTVCDNARAGEGDECSTTAERANEKKRIKRMHKIFNSHILSTQVYILK